MGEQTVLQATVQKATNLQSIYRAVIQCGDDYLTLTHSHSLKKGVKYGEGFTVAEDNKLPAE